MTTGHERPPPSPPDPSFSMLTFTTHPHFNNSRRPAPSRRSSLIGMEVRATVRTIHLHLRRPKECWGERWWSVGVGTLLVAFPDPPYRRYQDSRPTDQCRERRRRLGVHRRLLGRTAGHRRTLENRLMALQDPT